MWPVAPTAGSALAAPPSRRTSRTALPGVARDLLDRLHSVCPFVGWWTSGLLLPGSSYQHHCLKCLCTDVFVSLGRTSRSGTCGMCCDSVYPEKPSSFLQWSHHCAPRVLNLLILLNTCSHPAVWLQPPWQLLSPCGLICTSLPSNDAHPFLMPSGHRWLVFEEIGLQVFSPLKNWVDCFLIFELLGFFIYSDP